MRQPFSANLETQAEYAGIGLTIDYAGLEKALRVEEKSRGLEVLRFQFKRYRGVIPIPATQAPPGRIKDQTQKNSR